MRAAIVAVADAKLMADHDFYIFKEANKRQMNGWKIKEIAF